MPVQTTGINALTPNRIVVDAGAIYRNYGEASQQLFGATRGGATFTVNREDRQIEADGIRGQVKGLKRVIEHSPQLEFTLVEMSLDTFLELTRGTATLDATGGFHRIVPSNDIALSDYLINIALVGRVMNTNTPVVIILYNALQEGEWSITTADEDEGTLGVTFVGHYDSATGDSAPPYEILWPVAAS